MSGPANRDDLIQEFCSFTSADAEEAVPVLENHEWNVEAAVATWFEGPGADSAEAMSDVHGEEFEEEAPEALAGGGRTLGGGRAPAGTSHPAAGSTSRQPQRGLRTLSDLQGPDSHGHDDDDDHDSDQDFFAGGEKSGLAVQNPNNPQDQIQGLLDRARRNLPRPAGERPDDAPTAFSGRGVTLGGDDAPSRVLEDPRVNAPTRPPRVRRVLHLWQDGFSVDEGPLYRYDDPANADTLRMINSGRAPLDLLNVEHGQEVDLELDPKKEQKFVQLKKQYKPFSGSGQRLGSPTPAATASSSTPGPSVATSSSASAPTAAAATPDVEVDSTQPTVNLQIRLGDGTRLQSRFNTTHTIGDVYGFVERARPESAARPYALMTTFPSKELEDKNEALGENADLKRGGVIVQKWK